MIQTARRLDHIDIAKAIGLLRLRPLLRRLGLPG